MDSFLAILLILVFFVFPFLSLIPNVIYDVKKSTEEKKVKENKKAEEEKEAKVKQFIIEKSSLLKELKTLNAKYTFFHLEKEYVFDYTLKSKHEFDKFDPYKVFCDLCISKEKEFREIAYRAHENKRHLEEYDDEFEKLMIRFGTGERVGADSILSFLSESETDIGAALIRSMPYTRSDEFLKLYEIESCLLTANRANPVVDPCISIHYQYTTPKSQKRYQEKKEYSIYAVERTISKRNNAVILSMKTKDAAQRERSLLTDKLRYQVFQRDGFRCCICGASSKDGAQLHVDHIKPISKGGKTELNNLRTLCSRCNLGKGASYTEGGIN